MAYNKNQLLSSNIAGFAKNLTPEELALMTKGERIGMLGNVDLGNGIMYTPSQARNWVGGAENGEDTGPTSAKITRYDDASGGQQSWDPVTGEYLGYQAGTGNNYFSGFGDFVKGVATNPVTLGMIGGTLMNGGFGSAANPGAWGAEQALDGALQSAGGTAAEAAGTAAAAGTPYTTSLADSLGSYGTPGVNTITNYAAPAAAGGTMSSVGSGAIADLAKSFGVSPSTLLSVGGNLVGGLIGSSAAGSASKAQADAAMQAAQLGYKGTQDSNAMLKSMYDQNRADNQPFREAGLSGLGRLSTVLGLSTGDKNASDFGSFNKSFTTADFKADPGYQWQVDQGQKALERSQAAKGGLLSGAALKAASDYGMNQANSQYNTVYNRWNADKTQNLNALQSMAGVGQTANAANQSNANTYGTNASNNIQAGANALANGVNNAGAANASGYVGGANAWSNAIGGGLNAINQNSLMEMLMKGYR